MVESQCAVFDFRYNYESVDKDLLIVWLKENCKKWCFQGEQGDTGYKHWQGRLSLIKKRTRHQALSLFISIPPPNYFQPTTNIEHQKVAFYVLKMDTRFEGPYKDADYEEGKQVYVPKQYRNMSLYPFQEKILQTGNVFNAREINLIYDPYGCCGKSTVAAIGELLHNGIDMPPLNDFKELIGTLCCICMDKNLRSPSPIFFDMPRALDKTRLYGLYSAIEQVKKGKLYDMRYHYKSWWIDSPTIWVFTNILPDLNMLSLDRWKIWTINKDTQDLIPYEETICPLDVI